MEKKKKKVFLTIVEAFVKELKGKNIDYINHRRK